MWRRVFWCMDTTVSTNKCSLHLQNREVPCNFATWCWSLKRWIFCTNKITNLSISAFQVRGCQRATKCACATMLSHYSSMESMFSSWQYNSGPAVSTSATRCTDAIHCFHISESKTSPALNLECFNPYLIFPRCSATLCTFNDIFMGGGYKFWACQASRIFSYSFHTKGEIHFSETILCQWKTGKPQFVMTYLW